MTGTWVFLIYTVPAQPSRKRTFIWRELKKLGVVYLRDGVCALPERPDTVTATRMIAAKVGGFGGQATVVEGGRLDPERAEAISAESRADRAAEYREVGAAAAQHLAYLRGEPSHRELATAELAALETDVEKLKRWLGQVRSRDYFGSEGAGTAALLIGECESALGVLLEGAQGASGEQRPNGRARVVPRTGRGRTTALPPKGSWAELGGANGGG
ncbi:MAG: hypothetical protein HY329_27670 [Chloroflexi bacterium]|nr:hypothetical protein [Chloroflexota bacterium]